MLSVPSVTMKEGSRMRVTSAPFRNPNATVVITPHTMAAAELMPRSTAALLMTIEPSAMTIPHERSIPAVSTTSVWPMAITPITTTCCRISEKFWPVRKRSLCEAKNAHASRRAATGPACAPSLTELRRGKPLPAPLLLAPARIQAERRVFAVHVLHRFVGDERHAGVDGARCLFPAFRVLNRGFDAERGHLQRVLLRGPGDDPGFHVADAGAAAVDRDEHHAPVAASRSQRAMRSGRGRF